MPLLSTAWKVLHDLGLGWVLKRLWLTLQIRFGIVKRRLPLEPWRFDMPDWEFSHGIETESHALRNRLFFFSDALPNPRPGTNVCEQADRVLSGEWPFFSGQWLRIGFPPNWFYNPLDGTAVPDDRHWSEIDIDAIHDVKFVWEPNRFSVVYLLVRAYAASRSERYAEAFWKLVEDWAAKNPPNRGINWVSGQEVALRVMAWSFGLHVFRDAECSTAARLSELSCMIGVHGTRIAGFIDYALSQRNNHGIGEAVGLFTIGILFSNLHRAGEWRDLGRRLIESHVREQVYADGSYIQHSFNYERVFIDYLVWAFRLGEVNSCPFSRESYEALGKAVQFMLRFCEPSTGRMPNYGSNDGSLVLPLTSCDFLDYRPSLQAAHYLVYREFCFERGEWNEQSDWLFGPTSTQKPNCGALHSNTELQKKQPVSGYAKLTGRESYAMLRVADYVDRPSQADQLHLDLWWRGENVACDAGTYLYNAPSLWMNALAATSVHNTVTVAHHDQMTRAGRFLWLDWARAGSRRYDFGDALHAIEAWHAGYTKIGAIHRRSITCLQSENCWIVVDDIYGSFRGDVRLHWLFTNYPHEWSPNELFLKMRTPGGEFQCWVYCSAPKEATLVVGATSSAGAQGGGKSEIEIRGWRSLYYGQKDPALSLAVQTHAPLPVRFVTLLAPSAARVIKVSENGVEISREVQKYQLTLLPAGSERIFSHQT